MGIDVRGPQGPAAPATKTTGGPVVQQQQGVSALQLGRNAEGAFDAAFALNSGLASASVPTFMPVMQDNLSAPGVKQEIMGFFEALKTQFLQVSSDVVPAGSLEHPFMQQGLVTDVVDTGTLQELEDPTERYPHSKAYQDGMGQLKDSFFSDDMEGTFFSDQLDTTKANQYFQSGPGRAQVEKVAEQLGIIAEYMDPKGNHNKGTGKSGRGHGKGGADPAKPFGGPNQTNHSHSSNSSSSTGSTPQAPTGGTPNADAVVDLDNVAGALKTILPIVTFNLDKFGDMDIDSLIILMMGVLAKDAEDDLREMMKKMQHNMKIKNAKREMKRAIEDDQVKLKDTAQKQLDDLKRQGLVPDTVTVEEYMSFCQIDMAQPQIDEVTGDWATFPPTLTPPNPLPSDWRMTDDDPHNGWDPATMYGAIDGMIIDGDKQEYLDVIARAWSDAPVETFERMFKTSGHSKEEWARMLKDMGMDPLPANFNKAQDMYGEGGHAQASPVDRILQGLQDDIDTSDGQSEEDQTRLQLYMDRRAKAFEALSNLMKKSSDTLESIVKNLA